MTTIRDITLTILAAIALIGVVILTLLNKTVPSDLWVITSTLVGAVAGVAIPNLTAGKADPAATGQVP